MLQFTKTIKNMFDDAPPLIVPLVKVKMFKYQFLD